MANFGKALQGGLDILDALQQAETPLAYAQLSRRVDMSPASFTRFLKILVARGLVRQEVDGRYALGWKCAQLGQLVLAASPLRAAAAPHLKEIAAATEESAESLTFEAGAFFFLDRVESPRSVVLKARPGSRFAIHDGTAIGRLALCLGVAPGRVGCSTREKERIRRTGYAGMLQNNNEVYRGAAAVFDARGVCVGCLCVGAPAFRVRRAERKRFQELLARHAGEVSRCLGWSPAQAVHVHS